MNRVLILPGAGERRREARADATEDCDKKSGEIAIKG
jgi:hypothetical protein